MSNGYTEEDRIAAQVHDEWVEKGLIPDPYEVEGESNPPAGDVAGLKAEIDRRIAEHRRSQ